MAQFFKRRRQASPNKNEQKVLRGKEALNRERSAGLLSQRYPSVQRLSVQLEFVSPQQHILNRRTLAYGPSDICDFSVPCPGRCNSGSFDLAAKVLSVIEARQALSESSGTCQEPLYAGSPEACGLQLRCKIEVSYLPPV